MSGYKAPIPSVGLPVQWFPHHNPDETPFAALVISAPNSVAIKVAYIPPQGGARNINGVRYIEDPFFKTCGEQYDDKRGAWGFVPGLATAQPEDLTAAHGRIKELHGEGMAAPKIAEELGGEWNHQKVNGFLRRENLA